MKKGIKITAIVLAIILGTLVAFFSALVFFFIKGDDEYLDYDLYY